MAHYKRGRCRYKGPTRRSSVTFYRKRHNLQPIKLPDWRDAPPRWDVEYLRYHSARSRLWPDEFNMMSNWPRWHDILFHNRPRRRDERRLARLIQFDRLDAEATVWPAEKKPHSYYW